MTARRDAFTLIEIIIALTIFGLLMTAIGNAVHLTKQLNAQSERTGDDYLERYLARLIIEEDCRNYIEPPKGSDEPKFAREVLDDNQTIKFYTVVQRPVTMRGIYYVHYTARDGKLVRELYSSPGGELLSRLGFLADVETVSFRFGDMVGDYASDWTIAARISNYVVFDVTFSNTALTAVSWAFPMGQYS